MIKKVIWITTIGWMILIFYFSSQPGVISRQTSGEVLVRMNLIEKNQTASMDSSVLRLQRIIRKWAHFIAYFILGMLMTLSVHSIRYMGYKSYILSWLISTLYGVFDEIHQYFVPGRGCMVSDMVLDSLSALAGTIVILIVVEIIRARNLTSCGFFKRLANS